MLPATIAADIQRQVLHYLEATVEFRDPEVQEALNRLLLDPQRGLFKGPWLQVRRPYRAVVVAGDARRPRDPVGPAPGRLHAPPAARHPGSARITVHRRARLGRDGPARGRRDARGRGPVRRCGVDRAGEPVLVSVAALTTAQCACRCALHRPAV